mgnify:CR=1 FL=1
MNQDLLIRLFRSIEGHKNDDIIKIATLIIEDERKKGHENLALKLRTILDKNIAASHSFRGEFRKLLPKGIIIPSDKRNNIPLATTIPRDQLRHEMVLPTETEEKIRRIEKEFAAKERLAHHGLDYRQKILIYGASGCGKSMSAERVAWNLGLPFLKVRFDVIISSFLGETAINLTRPFEGIRDFPCVLLLDEFDFVGKTRTSLNEVGEMHRVVNILLTLLEEYHSQGILIATTNIENALDQALFRRFDDIIEMPKPNEEDILKLTKMTLSSIDKAKDIRWDYLVEKMKGLSSALVVKIAKDAAKISVIGNEKVLHQEHFEKSLAENIHYLK